MTIVAGQDVTASAQLSKAATIKGTIRFADGSPAPGYRLVAMWDVASHTYKAADANGHVIISDMQPYDFRFSIVAPSGNVNPPIGWVTIGSPLLSSTPTVYPTSEDGAFYAFDVWMPLLADGTPAEPQVPGGTEPGDTEPGDEEPGDTGPGDGEECTDPLTGQPADCEPTEPGDGTEEPEMCTDEATGAHYECNSEPVCEYMCEDEDTPDTSTIPEYPDTDLTTLAYTGSAWTGTAIGAGTLTLLGAGLWGIALWNRRKNQAPTRA